MDDRSFELHSGAGQEMNGIRDGVVVKKIVAITGSVLLVLLTGCSQINSAATIGKTEVPISTIQTSVTNVLTERSKVDTTGMQLKLGTDLNLSEVRFHVISVLFDHIATALKIPITDAQIATTRAAIITKVGSEADLPKALVGAGIASSDFPRYLRTALIAQELEKVAAAAGDTSTDGSAIQKLLAAQANKEKVIINPKYGTWDYTNGNVVPAPANSAVSK